MNCNSFNTKVNLPKFCNKLGYKDYQFKRLPTFGWYAYNKDNSFIGNIFDVVSQKDREYLYALISKEKPEYLDFDLSYSDMIETKIKYNLLEMQLWTAAYAYAKKELETYKTQYANKRVLLKDLLKEHGFLGVVENGMGVITGALLEKFSMLPWPKRELRGKILVPSFSTPMHICSLETCNWDTPTELSPVMMNDEKGWYGNLKHKNIVSDIKELWTFPGSTWDYKADYWFGKEAVNISEFVTVGDSIRIWTEGNDTMFSKSPLDQIIESGKTEELKHYIGQLSHKQLQEAEKATGEKLAGYWKKARESQVMLGNRVYTKRDNCYWIYRKGKLEQVTNFAIEIEAIFKRDGKFFRRGNIMFGDTITPFEMSEKYFTTNFLFHRGIKDKFLEAGIGIPITSPEFFNRALLLVDSFNAGCEVSVE